MDNELDIHDQKTRASDCVCVCVCLPHVLTIEGIAFSGSFSVQTSPASVHTHLVRLIRLPHTGYRILHKIRCKESNQTSTQHKGKNRMFDPACR